MNNQPTNLVYPLNIRSSEYLEAYHSSPPSKLSVVLNPIAIIVLPNDNAERVLNRLRAQALDVIGTFGLLIHKNQAALLPSGSIMSQTGLAMGGMSLSLMDLVTQDMHDFSVDGVYPNVSICETTKNDDPVAEHQAAVGMLCLDHWISATASTDPNNHGPLDVSEQCRQAFEKQIADNFTNGSGLCCESLVYLRSACQVTLRAMLLEQDPERAMNGFLASDTKDFFSYMRSQG